MISDEISDIVKKFTKGGWYHQRFDACPQFIYYIGESEVTDEPRKPLGTNANVRLAFYEDGKSDWYLATDDLKDATSAIKELAKNDMDIGRKIMARWRHDEKAFYQFFEIFKKTKLPNLSDNDLEDLYRKFVKLSFKRNSSSSVIDHFALGSDEMISQMLRNETDGFDRESEFTELFSALTAPVHQSFLNEAEENLLKIAVIEQKGKLSEKKKDRLLENHIQRYFWLQNNYFVSRKLDKDYFEKEIEAWLKTGKDLAKELKEISQGPKTNKKKKVELLKRYKLSNLLKSLLNVSENFTYWQDERKKCSFITTFIGNEFLTEFAKRTDYTVDEMKFMLPSEMMNFLKTKIPSRDELQKRKNYCAVLILPEKSIVLIGKDAIDIKGTMSLNQQTDEIRDIRGLVACTGRAIGTARILNSATEINKVNEGDVLVAVMTRPDYVPAMKKAAAIVTDEGGITSHAAIVSRELRKPCIIGTKIATKTFKDGDLIEVNANHNWVRKKKG